MWDARCRDIRRPTTVGDPDPGCHLAGRRTMGAGLSVLIVAVGIVLTPAGAAAGAPSVAARPSPGCLRTIPSVAQTNISLGADGEEGAYTVQAPASGGGPRPVIFDLHAYGEPGPLQVTLSGLGSYGQTRGFVTVTPWIEAQPQPSWHSYVGSQDLAWFGSLVTDVEADSCIDENRVFVAGYSNGAFMASAVACQYSGRVAAVAAVAGIQAESPCKTKRPVPVVAFHGMADPLVHYDGTPSRAAEELPAPNGRGRITSQQAREFGTRGIFSKGPSIPGEAAAWAKRNHCSATHGTSRIAADVSLLTWPCPHHADVDLYRIEGGGHTWPGSKDSTALGGVLGRTTLSISADAAMWRFFRAHPLTPRD
jgi:polyhydroxybutyrate depolymerase